MENIVQVTNLVKRYNDKVALDGVSVDFKPGEIVGLFGPNGSGKTTLIKVLANLLMNYKGDVRIGGYKPSIETKKIVSYLPDCNYLQKSWKVRNALDFFKDFYEDFDYDKAEKLLASFKIDLNKRIDTLSKGNKEKLQVILVLSRQAQVYLFDEPIAGVDPAAREVIFNLIKEHYNKNACVILTTHLISEVEHLIDRVVFINDGKIVFDEYKQNLQATDPRSINEIFKEGFRCF